ncbi:MAG: mandelate racemase/muconate lactonizing enzyme family protein [Bryobacteraceae bacterium]
MPMGFAAIRALEAAVKPVRITDVDLFEIDIPVSQSEASAGLQHRYEVAKVVTDAGVTGFSFAGAPRRFLPQVKKVLIGKDLFNVDGQLHDGLWKWGGVEHAVWDAIGKIAGQPVYKLLGGAEDRVPAYLTCVWPGPADQAHVRYEDQVAMAVRIRNAGFRGMKIRAWRPHPMDDVEVCRLIKEAAGKDFHLMFDRTAQMPVGMAGQQVWDFETGLKVARGLEKAGAYWLEEPFARDDYEGPAKLAAGVDILITGGESYSQLDPYRQCLLHRTYDILQPDGRQAGGIFRCREVAILAESFHVPVILHGSMSLPLAGWVQATLAIGSPWQELALITPPLLPEEQWAPGLKVLKSDKMFIFENGELLAPLAPGIGLDVEEDAVAKYRVKE